MINWWIIPHANTFERYQYLSRKSILRHHGRWSRIRNGAVRSSIWRMERFCEVAEDLRVVLSIYAQALKLVAAADAGIESKGRSSLFKHYVSSKVNMESGQMPSKLWDDPFLETAFRKGLTSDSRWIVSFSLIIGWAVVMYTKCYCGIYEKIKWDNWGDGIGLGDGFFGLSPFHASWDVSLLFCKWKSIWVLTILRLFISIKHSFKRNGPQRLHGDTKKFHPPSFLALILQFDIIEV